MLMINLWAMNEMIVARLRELILTVLPCGFEDMKVHMVGASFDILRRMMGSIVRRRSSSPRASALGLASTLRITDLVLSESVTLLSFSRSPQCVHAGMLFLPTSSEF